ncbi:MAG: flavodoxin [Lachnospiraceae bacterium]|nr:flavodoxin [Lachnospiraceae bacterium]
MAKLVVFYSRADENYFGGSRRYISTGNTERVANMIAEAAGADLFKIEQKVPYAADYDTCIAQAKRDLQAKARPELVSMPDSLEGYDEIYLGYPNYWGDMPMAVYTFLENFDWNGKIIHPFCTHEGSGLSGTEGRIRSVCKGATVTGGLAIQGGSVDRARPNIEGWV